mgnify:CR=1 FL=1
MTDAGARFPTGLIVDAKIRELSARGVACYVIQKGPYEGGSILVKVFAARQGAQIYSRIITMEGETAWTEVFSDGPVTESEADSYINSEKDFDPDLWILEIETKEIFNPFC